MNLKKIKNQLSSNSMGDLKEEHVVPRSMSTGEFMIECMTRGLNDFRKDLVVYDC